MLDLDADVSGLHAVLKGDDINPAPLILLHFHKKIATQLFQRDKNEGIDLHNCIKKITSIMAALISPTAVAHLALQKLTSIS